MGEMASAAAEREREHDHEKNTELLDAELPERRYTDTRYLRWLYDENPLGTAFLGRADEDGRRMAHYAVIPQNYRLHGDAERFVFSLHAVTRSGAQRKGYFSQLGEEIYEQARQWGALGVIGVSNDNSTPPVVKRLQFRLMGPLPVRVMGSRRRPTRDFESHVCDEGFLGSDRFVGLVDGLDQPGIEGWTNVWSVDSLRWRLAAPNCGPYVLHVSDDLVAVSTVDRIGRLPVAILLKVLVRRPGERCSGRPAVDAICAYHRTPVALHAGFNRRVQLRGVHPPRRLQPAPLNLIFRSLSPEVPSSGFVLDTFEFLDMDAY